MNKGIYRIAAGVGAAVILVSSATAQAATVTANGTPAPARVMKLFVSIIIPA